MMNDILTRLDKNSSLNDVHKISFRRRLLAKIPIFTVNILFIQFNKQVKYFLMINMNKVKWMTKENYYTS